MSEVRNFFHIMRPALKAAYDEGNARVIGKTLLEKSGVANADTILGWWKKEMGELYEAVEKYCRLNNAPTIQPEALKEAENKVYSLWKGILAAGEADANSSDLVVERNHLANLVSITQSLRNRSVNLNRDDATPKKAWAIASENQFRRRVETMIGIEINKIDVLSSEELQFLRGVSKALRRLEKAERELQFSEAEKKRLEELLALSGDSESANKNIKEKIQKVDELIVSRKSAVERRKQVITLIKEGKKPEEAEAAAKAAASAPKAEPKAEEPRAAETITVEREKAA